MTRNFHQADIEMDEINEPNTTDEAINQIGETSFATDQEPMTSNVSPMMAELRGTVIDQMEKYYKIKIDPTVKLLLRDEVGLGKNNHVYIKANGKWKQISFQSDKSKFISIKSLPKSSTFYKLIRAAVEEGPQAAEGAEAAEALPAIYKERETALMKRLLVLASKAKDDAENRELVGDVSAIMRVKTGTIESLEIDYKRAVTKRQELQKLVANDPSNAEIRELYERENEKAKLIRELIDLQVEHLSEHGEFKHAFAKILESQAPLGTKLKVLFKTRGITIVTLITAIGVVLSTLIATLFNITTVPVPASGPVGPNVPVKPVKPPSKPSTATKLKDWLIKMSGYVLSALPGIIGSVLSWVFKTLASVVGFLAEHLIILAIAGILAVIEILQVFIRKRK